MKEKRRFGQGWAGQDGPGQGRPGGRRLRFLYLSAFFGCLCQRNVGKTMVFFAFLRFLRLGDRLKWAGDRLKSAGDGQARRKARGQSITLSRVICIEDRIFVNFGRSYDRSNTAEPLKGWPYSMATRIPPGQASISGSPLEVPTF